MKLSTFDIFKNIGTDKSIVLSEEQLKGLQKLMLHILKDVIEVCEKHNISYSLGGGSVLGAIRHGGFIPWDDDMDLNMSRKDYSEFIKYFSLEFGEKYWIHTPEKTVNYNLLFARIRFKGTSVITRDDFNNNECGVPLDIFIIENTFDNVILRIIHGIGSLGLCFIYSCRKFYEERKYILNLVENNKETTKIFKFKIFVGWLFSFLSLNRWVRIVNGWHKLCKNYNSKYVSIPVGRKHFFGELYSRKDVCETRKEIFENIQVNCPINCEKYLMALYGDYMVVPEDSDKEKHIFFEPFNL